MKSIHLGVRCRANCQSAMTHVASGAWFLADKIDACRDSPVVVGHLLLKMRTGCVCWSLAVCLFQIFTQNTLDWIVIINHDLIIYIIPLKLIDYLHKTPLVLVLLLIPLPSGDDDGETCLFLAHGLQVFLRLASWFSPRSSIQFRLQLKQESEVSGRTTSRRAGN